jgi:hypothetical protein
MVVSRLASIRLQLRVPELLQSSLEFCEKTPGVWFKSLMAEGGRPTCVIRFYLGSNVRRWLLLFSTAWAENGNGNVNPSYQAFH